MSLFRPHLLAIPVFGLAIALVAPVTAGAQEAPDPIAHDAGLLPAYFDFDADIPRDENIPSPESVLGYAAGEAYTLHAHVVEYLEALTAASPRIGMREMGQTWEGRPLHVLAITSEANHARMDDIRLANLKLADPSVPAAEKEAIKEANPVVVWLSYNVHGNEASSTETAMQVAYRLASATDGKTQEWLDHAVVLIVPSMNPDGRDRYVNWYRSVQSHMLRTNASDMEHDEPWPGGRSNHYWFDLNRDWVWLVHPESRGRIATYQRWLPQVHTDYHEQGYNSNYFTMPGQSPRNLKLPDAYDDWADRFGRANAKAFDEAKVNYFTREAFDFFYPGYGSSYPSLFGGIGMLTEQGGHSRGGRAVATNDGYVLTLRQRIFDHFKTSLATIDLAVRERRALLDYFQEFHSPANRETATTAYLVRDDGGRGYVYDVVDMLLAHGVRVEQLAEDVTVRDAHDYASGRPSQARFAEGTFVIPTDQARHIFIETLMARQMEIEDSVMYDMSAWSVPLAYNLDAAWTESELRAATRAVTEAPSPREGVSGSPARYAYVVDWEQRHAPKALAALWRAGYNVRSATKTFTFGGTTYGRGSLVVLLGRNRDKVTDIHRDMARIADHAGVHIQGFDTGRMDAGIDLASSSSRPVKEPRVALVVDEGVSSLTAGQLWLLFDRWTEFGIDRIRSGSLRSLDWSAYDVLLMPGGSYGGMFDSSAVAALKDWVRRGGTVVATESAASWAISSGLVRAETASEWKKKKEKKKDDADTELKDSYYTRYEARTDSSGLKRIPGAVMLGHLDDSHPLAFGMGSRLYSVKFNTSAIAPSDDVQTVGWYEKDTSRLLVSGYASEENQKVIAGHAFAAVQNMGSGRVVLLTDNTQYRMFWVGPARLVQNAVMLMPGM
ncbi:MAG: hypothetical protein COV99_06610 [Bacteroidetes bacterium CG12_big_fil_rev_8_21_14_0_65_60_17]|nr:MAG: hypothetical protein COV99_06610 [Bacteroidetes bacterium CG12_big_fil_rev_8_21_14_0_65_60_17]